MNSEEFLKTAILYKTKETAIKVVSTNFHSDIGSYLVTYIDNHNNQKTMSLDILELLTVVASRQEVVQELVFNLSQSINDSSCHAGEIV